MASQSGRGTSPASHSSGPRAGATRGGFACSLDVREVAFARRGFGEDGGDAGNDRC